MATYLTVIKAAYRKIGLSSPTTSELTNGLEAINDMLSMFGADFLFPYLIRESKALTIGADVYTIGSGGDFNTVRPLQISSVYIRDAADNDFPIRVISAKEYNAISIKGRSGRPTRVYYIPEYSFAKIIFDYAPDAAYTAHFEFVKNFAEAASTSSTVPLPDEYKAFLTYNLAVQLAENDKINLPSSVYVLAERTKEIIESLIAAAKTIAPIRFDIATRKYLNIKIDDYED